VRAWEYVVERVLVITAMLFALALPTFILFPNFALPSFTLPDFAIPRFASHEADENVVAEVVNENIVQDEEVVLASVFLSEREVDVKPIYSEAQLRALGKVMVMGEYVAFAGKETIEETPSYTRTEKGFVCGTITFIDEKLQFAALAHSPSDPLSTTDNKIYEIQVNSVGVDGFDDDVTERIFGSIDKSFYTYDGLFGKISGLAYDPTNEMGFGLPEEGPAQIYLVMPDNQSEFYDIYIESIYSDRESTELDLDFRARYTQNFRFRFTDPKLPSDFAEYNGAGRSGSPIIQNGKLVGAYSSQVTRTHFGEDGEELWDEKWHSANFAADLRFALLQEYDESFDAELFKDVPSLKGYFDGWPEEENEELAGPIYTAEQLGALGRVMFSGDYLGFPVEKEDARGRASALGCTMAFVDEERRFAAVAQRFDNPIATENRKIYDLQVWAGDQFGITYTSITGDAIAFIDDNYFWTDDGFFGQMSADFDYNPGHEMSFGFPEAGTAQIFLEMPDGKSGFYEIYIDELVIDSHRDSAKDDFSFYYTDARLDGYNYTEDHNCWGRYGAPIIQHGRLVGVYSGIFYSATYDAESNPNDFYYRANLAADLRFAMLQAYDESFDAELFRNVPTLRGYFD
jgi:hypothetical protein